MRITSFAKSARLNLKRNSPTILTGMAVAGLITTTIMAVKATPRAIMLIQHEERDLPEPLTPLEVAKLCWKEYIPTMIMGSLSIACIISSNHISSNRNKVLMGMYTLADKSLKKYQDEVISTVGREKAEEIRDRFIGKRIDETYSEDKVLELGNKGDTLCYDIYSGRYFYHNIEEIRRIENQLNRTLLSDDFVSVNDFYYEVGLDDIKMGDEIGWTTHSLSNEMNMLLELRLGSKLTKDNEPCVVIDWSVDPSLVDYL